MAQPRSLILIVGLVLALGAGCGAESDSASPTVETTPSGGLDGEWNLESLGYGGEEVTGAVFDMTLDLELAIIEGRANCHRLSGSFTIDDAGLATFTLPGTSTTECSPADAEIEATLLEALEAVTNWTLDADPATLTLTGPAGTGLVFTR